MGSIKGKGSHQLHIHLAVKVKNAQEAAQAKSSLG